MKVSRLNNFFGAELQGIDLRNLKSKTVDELKSLWIEHKVLVIRNQSLTTEEHVNFAKNFGDLEVHPFARKHPDYQEILVLESGGKTGKTHYSANDWHSDVTYREKPPMGSILRGVVVPKVGGDTCFADAIAAYNRLEAEMKAAVSELTATHDWLKKNHHVLDKRDIESSSDPKARQKEIEQSLDRVRSPYRTAEMFGIEEIIDPRDTRPLLCDWVDSVYKNLHQDLGIKKRTIRP